jgi:hypothetical protein
MKDKIKNMVLSSLSSLVEGLLSIKTKVINMITQLKVKILDWCDEVHQMITEGDEELVDSFGIRTVRLMRVFIIIVSLLGVFALLSIIF